jgi:hypothetical protein
MELTLREEKLEARKNLAIEALSGQFSRNALPMAEYERLVEYINKAESERELTIIEKIVDETALYAGHDPAAFRDDSFDSGDDLRPGLNGDGMKFSFTLLSSRETTGDMLRHNQNTFVTILGNNTITINEGELPPGRTVLDVINILGETKITVPPGVAVTIKAVPIAGAVSLGRGVETRRTPGGSELVITGAALLGNITVRLRKERRRR